MKKILVVLLAFTLLFTSCSSPKITEEKPSSLSSTETSAETSAETTVDLKDFDGLAKKYLDNFVISGIASNWTLATEVDPDYYVVYYAYSLGKDSGVDLINIEPAKLEEMVMSHFDVTPEFLQISTLYDSEKKVYYIDGLGGAGTVKVLEATMENNILVLNYGIYSPDDESKTAWEGVVQIEITDNGYKYISNSNNLDIIDQKNDYDESQRKLSEQYGKLFDNDSLLASFKDVVAKCKPFIETLGSPTDGYKVLTEEQCLKAFDIITATGNPVSYYTFGGAGTEPVYKFVENYKAGKPAQVTIYTISYNYISAQVFVADGETIVSKTLYASATDDAKQEYDDIRIDDSIVAYKSAEITDNGYLIFHVDENADPMGNTGFKLLPYNKELYSLENKYLSKMSYVTMNIIAKTWDKENLLEVLNFGILFDEIYSTTYQTHNDYDYPYNESDYTIEVPSKDLEEMFTKMLPLTVEELRETKYYNPETDTYKLKPYEGGGYSPTPEVVSYKTNKDGSLTLTVHGVALEGGDDQSIVHELTVTENSDGTPKYLSNKVVVQGLDSALAD